MDMSRKNFYENINDSDHEIKLFIFKIFIFI